MLLQYDLTNDICSESAACKYITKLLYKDTVAFIQVEDIQINRVGYYKDTSIVNLLEGLLAT